MGRQSNQSKKCAPCALCGAVAPLHQSHLIPAWAHRQVKEHGKYLRATQHGTADIDQLDQQCPLLCTSCEAIIKHYDDRAKQLHDHAHRSPHDIPDGVLGGAAAFAVSVLWRYCAAAEPSMLFNHPIVRGYLLNRSESDPPGSLHVSTRYCHDAYRAIWLPYTYVVPNQSAVFVSFAVPKIRFDVWTNAPLQGVFTKKVTDRTLGLQWRCMPPLSEKAKRWRKNHAVK